MDTVEIKQRQLLYTYIRFLSVSPWPDKVVLVIIPKLVLIASLAFFGLSVKSSGVLAVQDRHAQRYHSVSLPTAARACSCQ